jgi:hypothetical protein
MRHKRERSEMLTKFQSENLKERDLLQDQGINRRRVLNQIIKKKGGRGWTKLISVKAQTSGRLL